MEDDIHQVETDIGGLTAGRQLEIGKDYGEKEATEHRKMGIVAF